jgi:hypothetical protein
VDDACVLCLQPFAEAPTTEALRALLNLDLTLECDGEKAFNRQGLSSALQRYQRAFKCCYARKLWQSSRHNACTLEVDMFDAASTHQSWRVQEAVAQADNQAFIKQLLSLF